MQGEVGDLRNQLEAMQQVSMQALKDRGAVAEMQTQMDVMKAQFAAVLMHHSRSGSGDARGPDQTPDRPTAP